MNRKHLRQAERAWCRDFPCPPSRKEREQEMCEALDRAALATTNSLTSMGVIEHLCKIREKCERLRAGAKNRSPGKWGVETAETDCGHACTPNGCYGHDSGVVERITGPHLDLVCEGDVFEQLDTPDGFKLEPWNTDTKFIASCAGPAEAGWQTTIEEIDELVPYIIAPEISFTAPNVLHAYAHRRAAAIRKAWPVELLD